MIALRLLSLVTAFLVLIFPAVLLADTGIAGLPGMTVLAGLIGMALVSGTFIYIAIAGDRMRRHARARVLGGVLLAVPTVGSLVLMASREDAGLLWGSGTLLVVSLVLFMGFVFPARAHRQRPMRRRERQDTGFLKLQ